MDWKIQNNTAQINVLITRISIPVVVAMAVMPLSFVISGMSACFVLCSIACLLTFYMGLIGSRAVVMAGESEFSEDSLQEYNYVSDRSLMYMEKVSMLDCQKESLSMMARCFAIQTIAIVFAIAAMLSGLFI